MAKKSGARIPALLKEVEKAARQLRVAIRKRAKAAPKNIESAANRLRKGAADVARQVEKYVHEIRVELERGQKPAPKTAKKKPKKKATRGKRRTSTPAAR